MLGIHQLAVYHDVKNATAGGYQGWLHVNALNTLCSQTDCFRAVVSLRAVGNFNFHLVFVIPSSYASKAGHGCGR